MTVTTYLIYLLVAVPLTIWVARTLSRNGRIFLVDVFHGNEDFADAVNRLLVVGFYLVNLGFVTLFLRTGDTVADAPRAVRAAEREARDRDGGARGAAPDERVDLQRDPPPQPDRGDDRAAGPAERHGRPLPDRDRAAARTATEGRADHAELTVLYDAQCGPCRRIGWRRSGRRRTGGRGGAPAVRRGGVDVRALYPSWTMRRRCAR